MSKIRKHLLLPVLTGLFLFVSMVYAGNHPDELNKCSGCDQADKCKIEVPAHGLGRFFRDHLGLDEKQHIKFKEFRQAYHGQRDDVIEEINNLQSEMFKQLDKNKANRSKLNELADKEGVLYSKLKQLSFDHYEKMRSVLNKDQQKKLAAIYKVMMQNERNLEAHDSHGEHHAGECGTHEGRNRAEGRLGRGEHGHCNHDGTGQGRGLGCGSHHNTTQSDVNVTLEADDVFEEFKQN